MAIPDFESIMLPLLKCVQDGKVWSMIDVEKFLISKLGLSKEDATQLKPSSSYETIFSNRTRWARFYMKKAGLLTDPKRGHTEITTKGIDVLQQNPSKIDNNFLKQFPSFVEFYGKKKEEEIQS